MVKVILTGYASRGKLETAEKRVMSIMAGLANTVMAPEKSAFEAALTGTRLCLGTIVLEELLGARKVLHKMCSAQLCILSQEKTSCEQSVDMGTRRQVVGWQQVRSSLKDCTQSWQKCSES